MSTWHALVDQLYKLYMHLFFSKFSIITPENTSLDVFYFFDLLPIGSVLSSAEFVCRISRNLVVDLKHY